MIHTLFWKEWREHRTVWVAMAGLSALLLIGLTYFLDPQSGQVGSSLADWRMVPVGWATLVLAVTYGLVCGAMMFAGEREGRTMPFLDGLPALRFEVWATKVVVGLLLTLAQSAMLIGIVTCLNLPPGGQTGAMFWVIVLPLAGIVAYAWGLFGSSVTDNVLAAIGVALAPLLCSSLFGTLVVAAGPGSGLIVLVIPFLLATVGVVLSGLFFTAPDWERWPGLAPQEPLTVQEVKEAPPPRVAPGGSYPWLSLVWLTVRQGWPELICYALLAPLLGLVLPSMGWLFWPEGTLLLGVLCGTAVFRPEQVDGSYRFLGDQRVPAWRVWWVKVGFWLAAGVGLTLLFLLAVAGHVILATSGMSQSEFVHSEKFYIPGGTWTWNPSSMLGYAGLGLLNGFAIGQLCGLVWRKTAVAVVVALIVGHMTTAVWLPSVIGGGVSWLQLFFGPFLLLGATLFAARAWLSDRLFSFRPTSLLIAAAVGALLWLGGNLAWRWFEVPEVGEPFDVQSFSKTVSPDSQMAQRSLMNQALKELAERETELAPQKEGAAGPPQGGGIPGGAAQPVPGLPVLGLGMAPPDGDGLVGVPERPLEEVFYTVLREGWKESTPGLERWLAQMCAADPKDAEGPRAWARHVREVSERPPVAVIDCRFLNFTSTVQPMQQCVRAAQLFIVRGKQHLARGEETEGIDCLVVALGLSRHLRHKAIPVCYTTGVAVEKAALQTMQDWLTNDACDPDVIRRVGKELDRHEAAVPPISDTVKAAYLTTQNTLNNPDQLGLLLDLDRRGTDPSSAVTMSRELALTGLQMPWEKARLERTLDAVAAGWLRAAELSPAQLQSSPYGGILDAQPFVRHLRPWVPSARGADAGMSLERLAGVAEASVLRDCLTPVYRAFEGRADS